MGKIKTWKNADETTPQQLHRVLDGSIKKKKDSKFKNTPTGRVALINKSKDKHASSQKDSKGTKSRNQKQSKQGSLNGKQAHPSKVEREKAIQAGTIRELQDFSSSSSEDTEFTHNVSTDDTSEDDLDTDRPSFRIKQNNESDEDDDDEDFQEIEEEEEEEDDDDDDDYETMAKHVEAKSFKTTKNNEKDQEEDDDEDSSGDDEDSSYDEDECLTFGSEEDSDIDEEEDKKEDKNKEEDCDSDGWYGVRYIKKIGKKRILLEEPDDMNDEDDYPSDLDWNEFDEAEEEDDLDESELGLRTLLQDTIVDDDDDDDFNIDNEDEDDDDDTSSEDENDEEEDSDEIKKMYAVKKKKADQASSKKINTQVRKDKENKDKRIVLVDNVSRHITEDEVKELFSPYGEILQEIGRAHV